MFPLAVTKFYEGHAVMVLPFLNEVVHFFVETK